MTDAPTILEATDVIAGYLPGVDILNGCSMTVKQGELIGIIGPNGAGKSTFLKALFGLVPIREGSVMLEGQDITNTRADELVHRGVGFVPQNNNVFPSLTIKENLEMGAYQAPKKFSEQFDRIVELFPTLGDRRSQRAGSLSGGERQRAWIAMLLAQQTRCLLLDEPISALDVKHQVETLRLVHHLAEDRALTVIVVLHDVDLAARFCDRLVALKEGQLVADGSPREIMDTGILESIYGVPMGVMERAPGQWVSYVH